jgi:hypothetical protein
MFRKLLISVITCAAISTSALAQGAFGVPMQAMVSSKTMLVVRTLVKGQKVCRSRRPDGSIKTWTCRVDQPCCVNHYFNLYTCGSQLLKCL